jgi:hypothetical protein
VLSSDEVYLTVYHFAKSYEMDTLPDFGVPLNKVQHKAFSKGKPIEPAVEVRT